MDARSMGAELEGPRLYGNAAMDMKAGCVANLFAMKILARTGARPGGTVILQSVIEEECGGGGGTLACLLEGYTADGMLVSEPFPFWDPAHPFVRTVHAAAGEVFQAPIKLQGRPSAASPSRSASLARPTRRGSPKCRLHAV